MAFALNLDGPKALRLSLDGKAALVTGGSRGIGAETVRLLREAGARVAFSYRNARVQAEALVTECGGMRRGGRAAVRGH